MFDMYVTFLVYFCKEWCDIGFGNICYCFSLRKISRWTFRSTSDQLWNNQAQDIRHIQIIHSITDRSIWAFQVVVWGVPIYGCGSVCQNETVAKHSALEAVSVHGRVLIVSHCHHKSCDPALCHAVSVPRLFGICGKRVPSNRSEKSAVEGMMTNRHSPWTQGWYCRRGEQGWFWNRRNQSKLIQQKIGSMSLSNVWQTCLVTTSLSWWFHICLSPGRQGLGQSWKSGSWSFLCCYLKESIECFLCNSYQIEPSYRFMLRATCCLFDRTDQSSPKKKSCFINELTNYAQCTTNKQGDGSRYNCRSCTVGQNACRLIAWETCHSEGGIANECYGFQDMTRQHQHEAYMTSDLRQHDFVWWWWYLLFLINLIWYSYDEEADTLKE